MVHDVSRRRFIGTLATGTVAAGVALTQAQAQSAAKQTKEQAAYQDKPKNAQMCAICTYFTPPASCQKVEGEVHPTGWCKNFLKK